MDADDENAIRLAELRASARGWHGVQLAVLGFMGLCGVLAQDSGDDNPRWLQLLVGVLVVGAFALACSATVLVGLAAWPIYGPAVGGEGPAEAIARTSNQLRVGIALTFVAVATLALATSSAWWPHAADVGAAQPTVEVTTESGVICGDLADSPGRGLLAVSVGGRFLAIALSDVVSVQPVDACT